MRKETRNLEALLQTLEQYIPQEAVLEMKVSEGSVGWHLEHSVIVINGILSSMLKSNPEEYKWKWNKARVLVYTAGRIPRGRKAPERVVPKDDFAEERVRSLMENIRSYYPRVEVLGPKHFILHPVFGDLHKKHTLRFIQLHTQHHLKIIREILQENKRRGGAGA